jgi:glycosyltransferase involved in cell wall biosynthesis
VHTVHGFLFNEGTRGLRRLAALAAERWTATWADYLLFQSAEDHRFAVARAYKPADRLRHVGNGVDEERFDPDRYPEGRASCRTELGLGDDAVVIGLVGRLVREKGVEEFFSMAGALSAADPRVHFLVVGITESDQSDAVDPHALAARHGLAGRCHILEQRHDMPELYLTMDLLVLPSYREGIPRALMEASAMGLPVVATDIRGCREVVADGETGLLYRLGDQDALVESVRLLVGDDGQRSRLGEAGRRRILGGFTEAATAERVAACYDSILATRRGG